MPDQRDRPDRMVALISRPLFNDSSMKHIPPLLIAVTILTCHPCCGKLPQFCIPSEKSVEVPVPGQERFTLKNSFIIDYKLAIV